MTRRTARIPYILAGTCLLLALCVSPVLAASGSVQLHFQKVMNFPVKYVTVNLNDPDVVVTPAVAQRFPVGLERWDSFLNRLQPDAAINGTYFCPHSCMPVGDIAIEGNLLFKGVVGTGFCLTPNNGVMLLPGPRQGKPDWRGYRAVLCAGPRLLANGNITLNARAEGFRDPRVLGSAPRSAIALRSDNVLIFLTIEQNISLLNLAFVCQHLNAVQALALDGGNSSALYAWGRTVTSPGRSLSNIVAIYSSRQRYQQMTEQFASPSLPILARLLNPSTAVAALPAPMQPLPQPSSSILPLPARAPIIRFVKPATEQPVRGDVPVTVDIAQGSNVSWISLRINGRLRAMTNTLPLEYHWDSTCEDDGLHTLEVCAWGADRSLLGRDSRQVQVQNSAVTAKQ